MTRKTDYALVALSFLGHRHETEGGPASARFIADTYHLPLPLLMNILKELSSAGLLTSTRGATGGYRLAKEPAEISVLNVVEAIEGPLRVTLCADENAPAVCNCNILEECPIRKPIRGLHFRIAEFFGKTSLADVIAESAFECCEETNTHQVSVSAANGSGYGEANGSCKVNE
ncbi:RrF2 family transcriptional regulator [Poriferisphaera corsica]|uniref:RrF2 family transcriptional regulator n=1 Tax=Poriferisphaera corsica TaxID=2528020 RepID=UPI00190B0DB2|nr:Rrf2 family transcriptional regulator [Poriferisphaera corsica]